MAKCAKQIKVAKEINERKSKELEYDFHDDLTNFVNFGLIALAILLFWGVPRFYRKQILPYLFQKDIQNIGKIIFKDDTFNDTDLLLSFIDL